MLPTVTSHEVPVHSALSMLIATLSGEVLIDEAEDVADPKEHPRTITSKIQAVCPRAVHS